MQYFSMQISDQPSILVSSTNMWMDLTLLWKGKQCLYFQKVSRNWILKLLFSFKICNLMKVKAHLGSSPGWHSSKGKSRGGWLPVFNLCTRLVRFMMVMIMMVIMMMTMMILMVMVKKLMVSGQAMLSEGMTSPPTRPVDTSWTFSDLCKNCFGL